MRTLLSLIVASIIAIVLWTNFINQDLSSERSQNSSEGKQSVQSSATLSDRDSAAEEVRAVAIKISNLEQSIEQLNAENYLERDKLRSEYMGMIEDLHLTLEAINQNLSNPRHYDTIDSLDYRVNQLETQYQQQDTTAQPELQSPYKFKWHQSEDVEIDPFGLVSSKPTSFTDLSDPLLDANVVNPHYTIPPTTTLFNATALTALVGRVPSGGNLQDPWRFKIIVGSENLAANGHRIPGLSGMLLAGTARGDMTLSCVSGNIDVATFIFSDGSIHTTQSNSDGRSISSGLGWISDEFGNPCIPGELKSNALNYLAQSTLVNALGGTAAALANAQTETTTVETRGDKIESIVGNLDEYVAGYAVSESLSGVSQWLTERQLDSFDAIYVPAGHAVAVHIEEPILIDRTPLARKVKNFEGKNKFLSANNSGFD